jgi:large subunit ribosomal protein L3
MTSFLFYYANMRMSTNAANAFAVFARFAYLYNFMKFILGTKQEMTQVWQGDTVVAVTRIQAGPCTVVQAKTNEKDGYEAVQIGYGTRKEKNINKAQKGHNQKLGNFRWLREFRVEGADLKKGDKIAVDTFEPGDKVNVIGISKGKGFQGVVRRYGFKGQAKTHGNKDQLRMPGSIGATGPAHVFKGQKMPGRMGGEQTTVTNLEIIEIDEKNSSLLIKGAVPGARNGLILVSGDGELKLVESKESKAESKPEENVKDKKEEKEPKKTEEAPKAEEKKEKKPATEEKKGDNKNESKEK